MNKKTKDILDIILGVIYVFSLIFCILGLLSFIDGFLIHKIIAFVIMLFALFINIDINKIFNLNEKTEKIAYNIFFYIIIFIIGVVLYYSTISYKLSKFLPILEIVISLISLAKNKDIKRSLISMLMFNIGIIHGSL